MDDVEAMARELRDSSCVAVLDDGRFFGDPIPPTGSDPVVTGCGRSVTVSEPGWEPVLKRGNPVRLVRSSRRATWELCARVLSEPGIYAVAPLYDPASDVWERTLVRRCEDADTVGEDNDRVMLSCETFEAVGSRLLSGSGRASDAPVFTRTGEAVSTSGGRPVPIFGVAARFAAAQRCLAAPGVWARVPDGAVRVDAPPSHPRRSELLKDTLRRHLIPGATVEFSHRGVGLSGTSRGQRAHAVVTASFCGELDGPARAGAAWSLECFPDRPECVGGVWVCPVGVDGFEVPDVVLDRVREKHGRFALAPVRERWGRDAVGVALVRGSAGHGLSSPFVARRISR